MGGEKFLVGLRGAKNFSVAFRIVFRVLFRVSQTVFRVKLIFFRGQFRSAVASQHPSPNVTLCLLMFASGRIGLLKVARLCEKAPMYSNIWPMVTLPQSRWADPGVLWKKAPEQWELWEGKPLKPYHFNRTLGAQKASSKYCQFSTAKHRELWEQNGL